MNKIEKYIEYSETNTDDIYEGLISNYGLMAVSITLALVSAAYSIRKTQKAIKKTTDHINSRTDYSEKYSNILSSITNSPIEVREIRLDNLDARATTNTVAYSRGLAKILTEDELVAVLLHEVGHVKNSDMVYTGMSKTIFYLLTFVLFNILLSRLKVDKLIKLVWSISASYLTTHELDKIISYKAELDADSWAKKYGYGKHLASALEKIKADFAEQIKGSNFSMSMETANKMVEKIQSDGGYPTFKKRFSELLNNDELDSNKFNVKMFVAKKASSLIKVIVGFIDKNIPILGKNYE